MLVMIRAFSLGVSTLLAVSGACQAEMFPSGPIIQVETSIEECLEALKNGSVLISIVRDQTSNIEIWHDGKLFTVAFQPEVFTCFAAEIGQD